MSTHMSISASSSERSSILYENARGEFVEGNPAPPEKCVIDLTMSSDEDAAASDADRRKNGPKLRNHSTSCFTHLIPGCAIRVLYLAKRRKQWLTAAVDNIRDGGDLTRKIVNLYFDEIDKYIDNFELCADRFNRPIKHGWKVY